ncbi:type VII secretion-associated serine protease mycosin [Catellatospora chokoriensis]|uniref:S8 family serine peptidase n=1 Tax=Catellatospora chokoriensis TaxID=310353 RepID=UPI0031E042E6
MTIRTRLCAAAGAALIGACALSATPAQAADPISDGQWYVDFLHLAQAHQINKGAGVTVAVIDTGVDATHPDLKGSVVAGADFSRGGGSDGLLDTDGHGTAMAGLIVGHGRIRGVAPAARVMSVRAATGVSGSSTATAQAITWAVEHGATVLSLSVAYDTRDLVLEQAVQDAVGKNVVIVAGVGNLPRNRTVGYPAAYPGVLAVGGVDRNGSHSPTSVTGAQVAIAAPCDDISTAFKQHQRGVGTGTSHATALVAGAAALLRTKFPQLPATEIVRRLIATAVDKGPAGRDDQYGNGVLDLVAALSADTAPTAAAITAGPPGPTTANAPAAEPNPTPAAGVLVTAVAVCLLLLVGATVTGVLMARRRRP